MRTRNRFMVSAILAGSSTAFLPRMLCAQLLTNMNFNQEVEAVYTDSTTGNSINKTSPVISTTTPILQTVTANDGMGGSASATYNVSVSSSVAIIDIAASGSATAFNNAYSEGTISSLGTTFYLSEPSNYNFVETTTGVGILGFEALEGTHPFAEFTTASGSETEIGTLTPGTISIDDSWGSGNVNSFDPLPESGTYSLSLTFTAIPEPSSACLIGIPVIASLLRRRRRVRLVPESA